jgi:SAM-dependent methyltransferase
LAGGSEPTSAPGSTSPDFGALAEDYDRLRPADENWWELVDLLVEEGDLRGRRVLDVGCGTGLLVLALVERGAKVWGVDPSERMLAQARAVVRLVVHLVDRTRAIPELRRIVAPGGRAVVATFTQGHFEWFWLTSFFPEVAELDTARFPTPAALAEELEAGGFGPVRIRTLRQRARLSREEALERIRGRYISTLRLLDDETFAAGLARAEHGLPETIESPLEWAVVTAERRPD